MGSVISKRSGRKRVSVKKACREGIASGLRIRRGILGMLVRERMRSSLCCRRMVERLSRRKRVSIKDVNMTMLAIQKTQRLQSCQSCILRQ